MIISRTPLRISFMGGGSDLAAYYQHEPGFVLTTAIDKYIYITVNGRFDHGIRASYSSTEIVERLGELKHELIRESMRLTGVTDKIELTSISDVPSSGTGMGSSSSYTVGLLNALHAFSGFQASAATLAQEACAIEIDICRKPIGKQDQYVAAYGGIQCVRFNPDGTVFVDPVICRPETKLELERRLLLLYTGLTRSANPILAQQRDNTAHSAGTRATLRAMTTLAETMRASLCANDIDGFGEMLHEGWHLKKTLAPGITSPSIDDWYERARTRGAVGGKLLGAGGGGFLLMYAKPEHHAAIIAGLPELLAVPFRFEPQGSKIIYVGN